MRKFLASTIIFLCLTAGARAACPYIPPITWYWSVQDSSPGTQVWNGDTGAYVVLADATYAAWLALGCSPTSIDTAANLWSTINSYASRIGRAPYQSYSSGAATVQMTNPVANYVNAALTNATPVFVLPKQNLPTSIGIGQQTLITAAGGFDITVKLVDGTTTLYTIKSGETASLVPVANDTQNGTWAGYTLPRVTPTNATNITAGTLAAARLAAFGSGDVSFASGGGAGTIAANAVTNAKAAQMANSTIKCRTTSGTGNSEDCTAAQTAAIIGTVGGAVLSKVVSATRDVTAASGTQDVTGFGFDPTSVDIKYGNISGTFGRGSGHASSNGPTQGTESTDTTAGTASLTSTTQAILIFNGAGNAGQAGIVSFITDGIRITWTKSGSPSANTLTMSIMGRR